MKIAYDADELKTVLEEGRQIVPAGYTISNITVSQYSADFLVLQLTRTEPAVELRTVAEAA